MNSYTDLSLACLSLADDLYQGADLDHSLQLVREICRRDPVISRVVSQLPRSPLPNFRRRDDLYPAIYAALEGTTIEDNPNYLMLNLFYDDESEALLRDFQQDAPHPRHHQFCPFPQGKARSSGPALRILIVKKEPVHCLMIVHRLFFYVGSAS